MQPNYFQPSEDERILFVSIQKSYNCSDPKSIYFRPSLYEATRKYWRLNYKKLTSITLLIGHVDGIIKEVIKPVCWNKTENKDYLGRYECDGIELPNSLFLEKSILNLIKLGQNPVNYYNV